MLILVYIYFGTTRCNSQEAFWVLSWVPVHGDHLLLGPDAVVLCNVVEPYSSEAGNKTCSRTDKNQPHGCRWDNFCSPTSGSSWLQGGRTHTWCSCCILLWLCYWLCTFNPRQRSKNVTLKGTVRYPITSTWGRFITSLSTWGRWSLWSQSGRLAWDTSSDFQALSIKTQNRMYFIDLHTLDQVCRSFKQALSCTRKLWPSFTSQ